MSGYLKSGDKGQRYEVIAKDSDEKEFIVGWSETLLGAKRLTTGINLHPVFHSPQIIDRRK